MRAFLPKSVTVTDGWIAYNSISAPCRKVLEELGPLPDFVQPVLARIAEQDLSPPPNHLLVNEYEAGQGIMPHTGEFHNAVPTVEGFI